MKPRIDACPRCNRAKRPERQYCVSCSTHIKSNPDVEAGYCHLGWQITPVPEATLRKFEAMRQRFEMAKRLQETAPLVERETELFIRCPHCTELVEAGKTKYGYCMICASLLGQTIRRDALETRGYEGTAACECGRKVTVGVPCRCGRQL